MDALIECARSWLTRDGHALCGQPARPTTVALRPIGSVLRADLTFPAGIRRIVVKQIAADANIQQADELLRIHSAVRQRSAVLAQCTPAFLGCAPEHRLIAMEYVQGPTLRDFLWQSLWLPGWREATCRRLLECAADVMYALAQFAAADFDVPFPDMPNRVFLEDIEAGWTNPHIRPYLPAHLREPEQFYRVLPAGFMDCTRTNLVPVDAQLKNTLLPQPDGVCYIDLDYLGGNPAISLAHFLVSLDRLGLRHPFAWWSARIAGWKQHFLDRYARQSPEVAEELVFFYPRVLVQAICGHVDYRPRSRWYLLSYYGSCLHSFLKRLDVKTAPPRQLFLSTVP